MKAIFLPMNAISKAEKHQNFKFGKYYKRQKFAALFVLNSGISMGLGGLILVCADYFLSARSSEFNQYGAGMIFIAFALIPLAIHSLDRIHNPAQKTGN